MLVDAPWIRSAHRACVIALLAVAGCAVDEASQDDDAAARTDSDSTGAAAPTQDLGALVRLNEAEADNVESYRDPETGSRTGWIELAVLGSDALDFTGWTLSDSGTEASLDGLVAQGGSFVVLSADDGAADGPRHLPFTLSPRAEVLMLRAPDGVVVDAVMWSADGMGPYGPQGSDESLALRDGGWTLDGSPTPGLAND